MSKMVKSWVTQTKQFFCNECGKKIEFCDICGRVFYPDAPKVSVVFCDKGNKRHVCFFCEERMNKGD